MRLRPRCRARTDRCGSRRPRRSRWLELDRQRVATRRLQRRDVLRAGTAAPTARTRRSTPHTWWLTATPSSRRRSPASRASPTASRRWRGTGRATSRRGAPSDAPRSHSTTHHGRIGRVDRVASGASGYYLNSYSASSTAGAKLTMSNVRAKRLAFLATKSPTAGTIEIAWNGTVPPAGQPDRHDHQEVLDPGRPVRIGADGTVTVTVVSSGKRVEIDGARREFRWCASLALHGSTVTSTSTGSAAAVSKSPKPSSASPMRRSYEPGGRRRSCPSTATAGRSTVNRSPGPLHAGSSALNVGSGSAARWSGPAGSSGRRPAHVRAGRSCRCRARATIARGAPRRPRSSSHRLGAPAPERTRAPPGGRAGSPRGAGPGSRRGAARRAPPGGPVGARLHPEGQAVGGAPMYGYQPPVSSIAMRAPAWASCGDRADCEDEGSPRQRGSSLGPVLEADIRARPLVVLQSERGHRLDDGDRVDAQVAEPRRDVPAVEHDLLLVRRRLDGRQAHEHEPPRHDDEEQRPPSSRRPRGGQGREGRHRENGGRGGVEEQ